MIQEGYHAEPRFVERQRNHDQRKQVNLLGSAAATRRFEVHFARKLLKKCCRICAAGYLEMSASFRSPSELGDLEG